MALKAPTVEEQAWMDAIVRIGCCVCIRTGLGATPGEVHHRLRAGRKLGHRFTLCLCPSHHRGGLDNRFIVSRDHNQRRFEARYGSEEELQEWTEQRVIELRACQV